MCVYIRSRSLVSNFNFRLISCTFMRLLCELRSKTLKPERKKRYRERERLRYICIFRWELSWVNKYVISFQFCPEERQRCLSNPPILPTLWESLGNIREAIEIHIIAGK